MFISFQIINYVTLNSIYLMRPHYHTESSSGNFIFSIDRSDVHRNSVSANFYTFIEKTTMYNGIRFSRAQWET